MARYTFRELAVDSRTGLNPRKNFALGNGNNYYITIKDIHDGKIVITDKTDRVDDDAIAIIKKRSRIKNGDVLFTSIGRIGETAIVTNKDDSWDVNESVFIFTLNTSVITQEYFCYLFQSKTVQEMLMRDSSGSTFKSIKMNQLEKMSFDIPDIGEQRKTAETLGKVSSLISLRKQQLAKLDELIKARFVELFGDPKSNNKKWKLNTFADICSVRQGLQIPISKRLTQYEEGCYEYITVAYLHGSKEREYIKNPKSTVICTMDDILMTRTGNTGMVITDVAGVFHNNFFLIDFDRTRYNKVFLTEYLNLDLIQAEIKRRAGTSTIPDLNHGEFYAIGIYEPPIELQNEFTTFVEQTDKSKLTIQQSLDKLETLKKSLMQKYFG